MTRPAFHVLSAHTRRKAVRAFTLLELLMVLGVAIALASLVMPLYTPMLDRQEFDNTVDAALAQCEQARAAAQERGMAIELVVTDAGTRLEARPVDLLADADDDVDTNGHFYVDGMERALQGSAAARALGAKMERRMRDISPGVRRGNEADLPELNESWTTLDLSAGVCASVEAPEQSDQRAEFNGGTDGRVALFLPDGSAIAARGCWLTWGSRSVRVDVNPLLGHAARRDVVQPKVEARNDV